MKNYAISQFILLAYLISGEVCAFNNNEETQKATAAQEQVTTDTKKQPSHQPAKSVVKEQAAEVNSKSDLKSPESGIEENPDLSEQAETQQVLDLSVPDKIQETTTPGNTPGSMKRDYLPDLFTDKKNKKNKKNKKLQVDGKFITREEEEIDKSRAVDGVGIDIRLTP